MARGPAASSSSPRTSQTSRFARLCLTIYFLCLSVVLLQFHFKSFSDILNEAEKNGAVGDLGPVAAALRQTPRSNDGNFAKGPTSAAKKSRAGDTGHDATLDHPKDIVASAQTKRAQNDRAASVVDSGPAPSNRRSPPPPPEPFAYQRHKCYQPTSPKPYVVEYCRPETHPALRERIRNTRKVLITYGENCCKKVKQRACDRGLRDGKFDSCFAYNSTFIDPEFATAHAYILQQKRGAGYWLWKPYIIRRTLLERMDWNEYLVYHDAGSFFQKSAEDLFLFLEDRIELSGGALFFSVGMRQGAWCKRDAFVFQNCDTPECHNRDQINGYLAVFKKTNHSLMILDSWLKDAVLKDVITDKTGEANKSNKTELEGFRGIHRHDQAVLTNVLNRDGWWYDWVNGPVHGEIIKHERQKG